MSVNWVLVDLVREGPVTLSNTLLGEFDARKLLAGDEDHERVYKNMTARAKRDIQQMVVNELGARLKVIMLAYPDNPTHTTEYGDWSETMAVWFNRHRLMNKVDTACLRVDYHDVMS